MKLVRPFLIYNPFSCCRLLLTGVLLVGALLPETLLRPNLAAATETLPENAQQALKRLPNETLGLPFALIRAAQKSDSMRGILATQPLIDLPKRMSAAELEPRLELSASRLNDENQPPNTFSPSKTEGTSYSAKVLKRFSTGTDVSLELNQSYTKIGFPPGSVFNMDPYHEAKASIGFSQSLLSNAFGYGTRRQIKSSALLTQANKIEFQEALDTWAFNFVRVYYGAWLAQKQAEFARQSLGRRERLRETIRLNLQRGTAEETDFLQVDSVYLQNKNQLDSAMHEVQSQWRTLVLTLKLPEDWAHIDPLLIPLSLDNPLPEANQACLEYSQSADKAESLGAPQSLQVQRKELLRQSAELELERSRNKFYPDLELQGRYYFNSIEDSRSKTTSEIQKRDHDAWSVGLNLTIPLQFNAEKALLSKSLSEYTQAYAGHSLAKDQNRVDWVNLCSHLETLKQNLLNSENALQNQQRRLRLEEQRFRIGRIPVFNVIQAGDDLTESEVLHENRKVQLRIVAWEILRKSNQIKQVVESFSHEVQNYMGDLW